MSILAYKVINYSPDAHIVCSVSPPIVSCDLSDILRWLIHSSGSTSYLKVVWDLSTLAKLVTDRLPDANRTELSRPPHRTTWNGYRLFYIPEKVLSLSLSGQEASFYDLAQYFPDEPEPLSLQILQNKAGQLQHALSDLGVPSPTTLSSPVAAFKGHELLETVKDTVPTIFDAPASVLDAYEIALQCTPREWVANYQIGHFPELWGFDRASSYPADASMLLDLRDCTFRKSDVEDSRAYYGFLVGDFTVYPDHPLAFCSPFLADRGDGVLVNFVGTKRDYPCLLDEVRTLYRYEMGEFKLESGWFISPLNGVRPRLSFQSLMSNLFAKRGNDELKSYLVKRAMNGIIGKMLEARKDENGNITEYGELYNPIYHALCTARTRLQVFDFLVQQDIKQSELVFVGVDGIKATRHILLPKQAAMGKWRCSGSEPTIVLSPGAVLTPKRNFKGTTYEQLLAECRGNPSSYRLGKDKNIDLHNLFLNQTRNFERLPRTGSELLGKQYNSEPVEL